jgi:hypothetical protein
MSEPSKTGGQGFAPSSGSAIKKRDIEAEEQVLEAILGSLDERRARYASEVRAEAAAAIERIGLDWGKIDYAKQLDSEARAKLLRAALENAEARAVLEGYVAHLQEHRAEFFAKLAPIDGPASRA